MVADIFKTYGLGGTVRLIIDTVITRIRFPKARIVRRPNYIRGKRSINFGRNLTTGVGIRIDAFLQNNTQKQKNREQQVPNDQGKIPVENDDFPKWRFVVDDFPDFFR